MSNAVTSLCRPLRMAPTRKAVLMALADYCHDDGKDWHSIAAIMEWTCLGRTAVIDALKGLEADGLIAVDRRAGAKNTTFLQVQRIAARLENRSATRTGTGGEPVREADGTGTPREPPPVRVADEPVRVADPKHQEASVKHQEASGESASARKPRASRDCPPDFAVTPDLMAWAQENAPGIDIAHETQTFRLHERTNAVSDWPRAWKKWMLKAKGFAAGARRSGTRPRPALLASNQPEDFHVPSA